MTKTYTKTQVEATEAMLLISKAERILANHKNKLLACSWHTIVDKPSGLLLLDPKAHVGSPDLSVTYQD